LNKTSTSTSAPSDRLIPFHFNDAGQQLIAEILAAEITARGW
jgi:lysophospholipase L1-like esterase